MLFMKRILSLSICLIFLAAVLATSLTMSAIAEPDNGDDGPTNPTSPTTPTTSTGPDFEVDLEFNFEYTSFYSNYLKITWGQKGTGEVPDGYTVELAKIGNIAEAVNDSTGEFEVDVTDLRPGLYTAIFTVKYNDNLSKNYFAAEKVPKGGELNISIKLTESNNQLVAYVFDEYANPVSGALVKLCIRNDIRETLETDESGYARFKMLLPQDKSDVYCVVEGFEKNIGHNQVIKYVYIGNGEWLEGDKNTTTSRKATATAPTTSRGSTTKTVKTTTTIEKTAAPTSAKATLPIVWGPGTTSVTPEGLIAINLSFDTGVLNAFNYSSKDFESRSRMLVSSEFYKSITDSTSVLYLLAQSSDMEITDQQISEAISGKSKYSLFHPEETLRIPMNLSLVINNKSLNTVGPVSLDGEEAVVELPVPKSVKASKYTFVAAEFGKDGITSFLDTSVEDGIIKFKTKNLSSVVLLGFKNPVGYRSGSMILTPSLIMIIIGLVLLASAFVLLYIFFLRKPREGAEILDSGDSKSAPLADGVPLGVLLNKDNDNEEDLTK